MRLRNPERYQPMDQPATAKTSMALINRRMCQNDPKWCFRNTPRKNWARTRKSACPPSRRLLRWLSGEQMSQGSGEQADIRQHSGWLIPLGLALVILALCGLFLLYDLRPGTGLLRGTAAHG